jgi:hypothetical protein
LTDFYFIFFNFQNILIFENYEESLNNQILNDFISIFLNYYNFNLISFLIICILLLIGSIICVTLNKINYFFKNLELKKKKFFSFNSFLFFRKQNLINQSNSNHAIRIVKKK